MQWNGTTCFEFDRKPMDTEITAWSTFHNGRKAIVEKTIVSEERNPKGQDYTSHSQRSEWEI